jgi:hypothetical protein
MANTTTQENFQPELVDRAYNPKDPLAECTTTIINPMTYSDMCDNWWGFCAVM